LAIHNNESRAAGNSCRGEAVIRIETLIGAGLLAMALAGCLDASPMAPVAIPSSHARLKLCAGAPALPPTNLVSNPKYVEFSVDVIDSTGAAVNSLTQSDFVATENGRPIPVAYFRVEQGRPPVSIALLVDKSGSMVTKLPVVSASVDALLPKLDACDEVMLYAFGMDPILVQDFTTDHALVGERLKLIGAWGQTPFYDGVRQGVARLDASHYPDRVAIIFTDDVSELFGPPSLDNASTTATRNDIVSSAVNSQSRFFVVGVGKPGASTKSLAVAFGPWAIGNAPNGVGAQDMKTLATDLQGEFFLVAAEPDENAPKVQVQPRDAGGFAPTPQYAPLAADPGEVQQFATSLAAQIDRHYTIGLITSGQPTSAAGHIAIKANLESARTTFHQIKVTK
jgi:VWFA-related protein